MNHTPHYITNRINEFIAQNSGFDPQRDYLGISHLGDCPRKAAREFRDGYNVEWYTHHMAYAGYEQQRMIMEMLMKMGFISEGQMEVEVAAPFDNRLRGHMDGLVDGSVVEIKSINQRQFDKLSKKSDKVLWKHFVQVQMYMRYSGTRRAIVIYRNRETYEHMVVAVPYNEVKAAQFEERAKLILASLDDGKLPECECGQCKE